MFNILSWKLYIGRSIVLVVNGNFLLMFINKFWFFLRCEKIGVFDKYDVDDCEKRLGNICNFCSFLCVIK